MQAEREIDRYYTRHIFCTSIHFQMSSILPSLIARVLVFGGLVARGPCIPRTMDGGAAAIEHKPPEATILEGMYQVLFKRCTDALSVKGPTGLPKHVNLCTVLEEWIVDEHDKYSDSLKKLFRAIINATGGTDPHDAAIHDVVPVATNAPLRVLVGLWQLGYREEFSIKGASPSTDVLDCLQKFILKGNETQLYPLHVLYMMNAPARSGSNVENFSVGLSQGFAVTMAAHFFCHHVVTSAYAEEQWASPDFWGSRDQVLMAQRLRQCVQMCATYRPAADLEQQVFAAISAKKQASLRQPPNLLQLGYAFNRIIEQRRLATTRKTNVELLNESIKVHPFSRASNGEWLLDGKPYVSPFLIVD